MMDVVFITDYAVPRLGMQKAFDEVMAPLADGLEIRVVTMTGPRGEAWPANVESTELGNRPGIIGRIQSLPEIRQIIRAGPDQVFVAVGIWAILTALLAGVGYRRRFVLWEHSVLPWRIRHEPKIALAVFLLRFASYKVSRVVAVSDATSSAVKFGTWPFAKHVVIPNIIDQKAVVDTNVKAYSPKGLGRVNLLGLGTLNDRKNWSLVVDALPLLPENFCLTIAGEGENRTNLVGQIARLGLEHRVTLLGYVDNGAQLIRSCDVVVHPSYAETFGYAVVEAALESRPVVVLPMPVMNEFVPRFACGIVARDSTPLAYSEAILAAAGGDFDYAQAASRRQSAMSTDAIVEAWIGVAKEA